MISANTAPGTKVVCIDDALGKCGPCVPHLGGLKKGAVYTVLRMNPDPEGLITVVLAEIDRRKFLWMPWEESGFYRSRFRYLELPSILTEILAGQPIKHSEHV
jgi:hypothetical protein